MSSRRRGKRLKTLGLVGAGVLIFATAATLGVAAFPKHDVPDVDPGLQSKAAAYSKEVADRMSSNEAAFEESRRVHATFPADRALRLLYVGDSLADGHSATRVADSYRPTFTAEVAKKGDVKEYRSEVLKTELKMAGNVVSLPQDMDVVIVELGTNDASGGGRTPIDKFVTDYEGLISNVKATSPAAVFVCMGTWRASAEEYDKVIEETCGRHGGKYIDLTDVYNDVRNRGPAGQPAESGGLSDDAHPNNTGYAAIKALLMDRVVIS